MCLCAGELYYTISWGFCQYPITRYCADSKKSAQYIVNIPFFWLLSPIASINAANFDQSDRISYDIGKSFDFTSFESVESAIENSTRIDEILQIIRLCAAYEFGDPAHGIGIVKLADEGGAKLVVDAREHNEGERRADELDVEIADSDGLRIFFGRIFDIHRDLVAKSLGNYICKPFGVGSVGVKLDLIVTDIADLAEKILEIGLKKRLASADRDAVKYSLSLFQMFEHLLDGISLCASRIEDEGGVVAEGSTQVTATRENGAGGEPVVIEKRQFIKALNIHFSPILICRKSSIIKNNVFRIFHNGRTYYATPIGRAVLPVIRELILAALFEAAI